MRKKLVSLLTAVVLSKFVVPAMAQGPEAGVLALPSGNPPLSVKAQLGSQNIDAFALDRWITWCIGSPDMRDHWVEFTANQGPIAKAMGLPAPVAQERHDAAAVLANNAEPARCFSSYVCFPFRSDNTVGSNNGSGARTLFDFWPHTECPVGNVVGLSSTYSDLTAAACEAPACAINWNGGNSPGVQFSGGAGASFVSGVGFGGHQNHSQFMGTGASVWLGCTTESGIEIRAGFSQQFIESRR